jgi:acyl carrier protein
MTFETVFAMIQNSVEQVLTAKGLQPPKLDVSTPLLGSGLGFDSLDLATIVIDLETITGVDPFRDGFREFTTAGELAQLYLGTQT